MCDFYYVPIYVGHPTDSTDPNGIQWNYFAEMKNRGKNRIQTFLYKIGMKTGDYVLLYISQKGLGALSSGEDGYKKECGFYAIGRILSGSKWKMEDQHDKNYGKIMILVDIEYYNLEKPLESLTKYLKGKERSYPYQLKDISNEFLNDLKRAKASAEFKPFDEIE